MLFSLFLVSHLFSFTLPLRGDHCSSSDMNIFFIHPKSTSEWTSQNYHSIETALYNHPNSNVYIFSMESIDFTTFSSYCVTNIPLDLTLIFESLFSHPLLQESTNLLLQKVQRNPYEYLAIMYHVFILLVQHEHGGMFLPMEGFLLNPLDYILDGTINQDNLKEFVFELLANPDRPTFFTDEDFEQTPWQRAHTDRHENITIACGFECPRLFNKNSMFSMEILSGILSSLAETGIDFYSVITGAVKRHIKSVILLPYWLMAEPKFPDHWKSHGRKDLLVQRDNDMFYPRWHKESPDWESIVTSKFWIPTNQGAQFTFNVFPKSIIAMVRSHLTLGLSPIPWRPLFGAVKCFWARGK
jgi:hypothetical protein